ncbi:Gfo/Idh/MocA family oxidoreductase [Brucella pituitosa]|uniref:Gfo/Idh/MocA family protein n=1 Tax=Brucella pituitosa TaxID=571256 RepID=UPI002006A459|nr:Gfo/Idh/MocA family oxidoreductase [Brucella pituitosa]MCK4207603.1 Gfo/Idh/MocA family oxidoreductase [Brucella pituitosa]
MCLERKVRFGIVGAGVAAETHARELAQVNGASLVSIYARDEGKARSFANSFAIQRHFSDLDAFLADPELDAVIITTPNGLHLDPALAAANAGKHLVIEKPLEISEDRAARIVAASEQAGIRLFVVYQRRFSNAAAQAYADIRSGRIGKVVLVNIVDNQYRKPSYYIDNAWRGIRSVEGGGCVMTQSTHLLDLAQYLVGPVRSLFANTRTIFHDIETEDVAIAALEFENGAIGTFSSSTSAFPGSRHLLTIAGTRGTIIINGEHDQVVFRQMEAEPGVIELPEDFSFVDPIDPRDYPTLGQRKQLQSIVDSLRSGVADERMQGDPLATVRLIDAIYQSADQNKRVYLRVD